MPEHPKTFDELADQIEAEIVGEETAKAAEEDLNPNNTGPTPEQIQKWDNELRQSIEKDNRIFQTYHRIQHQNPDALHEFVVRTTAFSMRCKHEEVEAALYRKLGRPLDDYELHVLSRLAAKNAPEDPGAAWWQALEVLIGGGYIENGELSEKGRVALARGATVNS